MAVRPAHHPWAAGVGEGAPGPTTTLLGVTPTAAGPERAWSGLLLLCLAGVVWGTIGPAVDVTHDRSGLSALTIGAYRSLAAVGVLVLATTAARRWRACRALLRQHGPRVALTGLLTALFQLLFFVAVVATGVSVTTVVALGFAPVLLLFLASARRRRPPSVPESVTVATALLGLLLVSTTGGAGAHAPHPAWGVLAALGSGAAYALSADVGKSLTHEHDALAVTTCTVGIVAVVLVPVGVLGSLLTGRSAVTSDVGSWALMGYLGVVTMAFAYVLLYAGLRSTPSGKAVVATLLEPVTAVVIAVLFLGETLSWAGALGCLLILAAISSLGRRMKQPQAQ